jgi:hypothetical protein
MHPADASSKTCRVDPAPVPDLMFPIGALSEGGATMLATSKQADYAEGKSRSLSIIGEDLLITGDVRSEGEIQLDGQLHGDVHCASLIVGESSRLVGESSLRMS